MGKVIDILQGHINEVLGLNDDLSETRLNICKECLIFKWSDAFGPICDSNKWIKEDGSEWSDKRLPGFIRGCGCRLSAKTKVPHNHCIIKKW